MPQLRVGDVFDLSKQEWMVVMVNDCRARCLPTKARNVSYKTLNGKVVEFSTTGGSISISPVSDMDLKQRLGEAGMLAHIESIKGSHGEKREERKVAVQPRKQDDNSAPILTDAELFNGGVA